jgi:6-pyruvoyltetrahydropterin/6-carboxytetrahydropterin synthase
MERVELDRDIRYIDGHGNLLRSRTQYALSKVLSYLGHDYEYDVKVHLRDNTYVTVDFKVGDRYIEIIDSEADIEKFKNIQSSNPDLKIIAFGHSKFAGRTTELESLFFFNFGEAQTGSIFIEDPSLAFDYAHILPLVEKCSILHGHTSTIMVEIIGEMKNNLVIDFGEAKRIIKDTLSTIDHKFFISRKYLKKEDDIHYHVAFEGPKGYFDLQVPKITTYLLRGEATVETLSTEIIRLLAPKMPSNVQALGVYVYEGMNKGSHIIAEVGKKDSS